MAKKKRLTKKQKRIRNRWLIGILFAIVIFFGGYLVGRKDVDFTNVRMKLDDAVAKITQQVDDFEIPAPVRRTDDSERTEDSGQIHIFDIGQGSSILLKASDGSSILIDTGRHNDSEKRILSYLDQQIGLGEKIDLVIFTHNDSDHIGNGDLVLEYFDVQEVWMSGMDHTTAVYNNILDALLASGAEYNEPKAGENYTRGDFEIQVLHPPVDSPQKDQNDESIVTRISFAGISFINSGDASTARENEIINREGTNLSSDIMMLGHHGAASSTGDNWIAAVKPQMAFYQAGIDNSYKHPSEETLERLADANVPVYGTDELGNISIYIDEVGEVTVETEK